MNHLNSYLMERNNLKLVGGPVDLNTAAVTGERISMAGVERLTIIALLGTSLTGANVTLSLKQHNAASAGTSKALSLENPYFVKSGADTAFTKVTPDAATDSYNLSTTFDTDGGIVVFEILGEDLDTNGGFTHVSLDLADATVAKVGAVLAVATSGKVPAYDLDI